MRKNIITQAWLADFYAEGLKPKFKGALKRSTHKPSSNREQEESPQAKGSSFLKSPSSRTREPGYKRTSWSRAQATRTKVFFLCLRWKDI